MVVLLLKKLNKGEAHLTEVNKGGRHLPTVGFSLTALFKDDSNVLIAFMTKDISAMRVLCSIKWKLHK